MSDDELWSEVVNQVLSALDEANVSDPSTRAALTEGVKTALESLESDIGIDVQIFGEGATTPETRGPTVEVVAGGRSDTEPPSTGEKPALRIAELEPDSVEEPAASVATDRPLFTHVQIKRPEYQNRMGSTLSTSGWIRIDAEGQPEARWQAIYLGTNPRLYRIGCTAGILDVTLEGEPIERLTEGQSVDVEGTSIRVTTEHGQAAEGQYVCMLNGGAEE
tara:strand:- start:1547 stop:2206 length:660 start_codon:yes stop_codon:yes gene_type:complete